jgi:RNA polymerase sigma factor (sigma-70 family)
MTIPPNQNDDFSTFFKLQYRSIVATVMRAGASLEDAEDAVIEAMNLAAPRFHLLETPGAWVRVVAVRCYARNSQRERGREQKEQLAGDAREPLRPDSGDLFRHVREILNTLPQVQRVVLALSTDGYTTTEIARMLRSSQDTVRSNLRHARRAMAVALKKGGWL